MNCHEWKPIETALKYKDDMMDYGPLVILSNGIIEIRGFWCSGVEIWTGETEYWIPAGWYDEDFEEITFAATIWKEIL